MGPLIAEHEGTLDRFAGDGILVFFNDPLPIPDPGRRAAQMALAMRNAFGALRERWAQNGYDLDIGMGLARGYATLGAFGYEGRIDYTAIGTVVNLAARLCGEADGGTIVVDRRMRAALDDAFAIESLGTLTLKGYAQPVPAFRLAGMSSGR
jgi:class 3 adenylate cyclase